MTWHSFQMPAFAVVRPWPAKQRSTVCRSRVAPKKRSQLLHMAFGFGHAGFVDHRLPEKPNRMQATTAVANFVRWQR
jgi:hypothetical protein